MKYFNPFKSFTLKWWQGSLFKIALISLGIAIGANWPEIFAIWTGFFSSVRTIIWIHYYRLVETVKLFSMTLFIFLF